MKLIATNHALSNNLARLHKDYPHLSFAVAWASANTDFFKRLTTHQAKIGRAVIGTHFYQTDPDVMNAFVDFQPVRFLLQPKGTFHPKVYLFWNSQHWEALIGSANLTLAALTDNSEAMILVSDLDEGSRVLREQIFKLIDEYWEQATTASTDSIALYRALWKTHQPALRKLSGQYGNTNSSKAPTESLVMSMPWEQYLEAVKRDNRSHGFEKCCKLLEVAESGFSQNPSFASMELARRKTIAGLPNGNDDIWGWFGSMTGAGYFHQAVNKNDPQLSRALDMIPSVGQVTLLQYDEYISRFVEAFPKGGVGVAVASRLLAMKRPDHFVCIASKNCGKLCDDFGIKKTGMDYGRYWAEIIERIMDSPWWNSDAPIDKVERRVWNARAAMLDAIFYSQ